ncbi:uracil nucleotide/cysteinyl leukotriene receptor-like [Xyrichtys novacula]|uniref:Uracil nucleotide/cysteinyl leukotriene receptor-like n=1 Tax=Xyrichtys novacula TaxID=13765 RepID=A0AAV1F069_XYRNO|nr:uracil nucleotide/cysteinyl leukotriene receptor-like [Xyrichtys novacula]
MIRDTLVAAIFLYCDEIGWTKLWFTADSIILITGVLANTALLWLFIKERKQVSASQVLGVNIVLMDLIYLCVMPLGLVMDANPQREQNGSNREFSASEWEKSNSTDTLQVTRNVFSMFNLIGCPLLLSCMCIERYVAVLKPVLYLKVRKREYRMAISAVVWVITLSFCIATATMEEKIYMMLPVSLTISCLFILMLACLCGVIWSLLQQSPAHTCSESPQKKRAVHNVLVVVVPAVVSYLPVLAMVPLVIYIQYNNKLLGLDLCYVVKLTALFPRLGVFIGPLFFLSKARQLCCIDSFISKH